MKDVLRKTLEDIEAIATTALMSRGSIDNPYHEVERIQDRARAVLAAAPASAAEPVVEFTEWERSQIASWAAGNAMTYMQHSKGLNDGEKVQMENWKALSDKFKRTVVHNRPQTIISGGRLHGKTIKLIQHAAETGAEIAPSDPAHADRIIRLAMEMGYRVWSTRPIGGNITVRKP